MLNHPVLNMHNC